MERPCICGCMFKDHVKQEFNRASPSVIHYCRNQSHAWCYTYTPLGNLAYLKWLYDKQTRH